MLNSPQSPLLSELERLAALTDTEGGILRIKPFRDWKGTLWQNKLFQMRLLNAGEMLEVYDYCEKYQGNAKDQAFYIEIIIRSLFGIDESILASDEEVLKYNEQCKTKLSRVEYLRLWAGNLEQVVLLRLYSIYEQLQAKQIRKLNDQYLCEVTGKISDKLQEGDKIIDYGIGEIISKEGLEQKDLDLSIYNLEDTKKESIEIEQVQVETVGSIEKDLSYMCTFCEEKFSTVEELAQHRENCSKAV